ncbi:WD40-repeat-containing domain protein [Collybia nuda]|uniref:WD40-repeat-containing domain protein n=1 Tax=Collybia nuda TaxID=64659 RepID=A0A9P5XT71_9AGAR|nr:WD40-repeat-containing domain protein [Collybia nuda]
MHKIWKTLIRRLKAILKNKNTHFDKDNYKLFKQLLTEISDVDHVSGQNTSALETTLPKIIEKPPLAAASSPDGKLGAEGREDGIIHIYDLVAEKYLSGIPYLRYTKNIELITFSFNGEFIASVSENSIICIWNIEKSVLMQKFVVHGNGIVSSIFSPSDKLLLTISQDASIHIWNIQKGLQALVNTGHTSDIVDVNFSPDESKIVTGSCDHSIAVWNAYTGAAVTGKMLGHSENYEGPLQPVTAIVFSPDNKFIACGAEDGTVHIWSVELEVKALHKIKANHRVVSLAYSPDGTYIACGLSNGVICFWDAITGALVAGKAEVVIGPGNSVLAISMDSQHLATGSTDGILNVWNTSTGGLLWGPQHIHTALVSHITFSTDSHYILTAAHDNTVCVWDTYNGRCLKQMKNVSSKTILQYRFQIT